MNAVYGAIIGLSIYLLERYALPLHIFPDSVRYLKLALHQPVCQPFHRRWLLPTLCRTNLAAWTVTQALSAACLGALAAQTHGPAAAWLLLLIPALSYIHGHCPVLTDLPSLTLAYAASLTTHNPLLCIPLALLSGACKESGPVFAAAYSLNPLPLVGLFAVRWWGGAPPENKWHGWNYKNMFLQQRVDWRDSRLLTACGPLLPLTFLGSANPLPALASLLLGFATTAIATDRARLLGWAAPGLLPVALSAPPIAVGVACAVALLTPRNT